MQENKTTRIKSVYLWLPFMLSVALVTGVLIGLQLKPVEATMIVEDASIAQTASGNSKIDQLLRYIESKYVDEVDRDELVDEAIENILGQLDPHSSYISAEELESINEQMQGNFEGIGVEFMILEDTVVVISALSGGPAESVGVKAGDRIVAVEDSIIAGNGITNAGIISLLKGKKGTTVEVGILRTGIDSIQHFEITRDEIPLESIDANYMISDNTGYIKVNRFAATTDREFIDALEELQREGMEDLILDLRHNPGGYLQKATNMLNQLFDEKGNLMVYTQGRAVSRNDYNTSGRSIFNIDKIAVLIDEGTASASEIMAGAIQDHDRGILVGRRSFGKGLVQEQYQLRDGSALRLTIARYYTPSGRSIQKPYDDTEAYRNDFNERYESGELLSANNISIKDSTRYFTDNGRVVFGGGGIIPDVFVPLDTQLMQDDFLILRQFVPSFSFQLIQQYEAKLKNMDLNTFVKSFQIAPADFQAFLAYAKEQAPKTAPGIAPPLLKEQLKAELKARIGKHFFQDEGYFQVINQSDPMITTALDALADYREILRRKQLRD
ncbi:MAG TPA: S41 family peptidase [Saprospiraceae bacterium]|nr:S41 family peptidase [Saprospiraceae bacterium]